MPVEQERISTREEATEDNVFSDLQYICNAASLITDSLQKGLDVAQLSNGDIIITEIKTINTHYSWNENKGKLIKISRN